MSNGNSSDSDSDQNNKRISTGGKNQKQTSKVRHERAVSSGSSTQRQEITDINILPSLQLSSTQPSTSGALNASANQTNDNKPSCSYQTLDNQRNSTRIKTKDKVLTEVERDQPPRNHSLQDSNNRSDQNSSNISRNSQIVPERQLPNAIQISRETSSTALADRDDADEGHSSSSGSRSSGSRNTNDLTPQGETRTSELSFLPGEGIEDDINEAASDPNVSETLDMDYQERPQVNEPTLVPNVVTGENQNLVEGERNQAPDEEIPSISSVNLPPHSPVDRETTEPSLDDINQIQHQTTQPQTIPTTSLTPPQPSDNPPQPSDNPPQPSDDPPQPSDDPPQPSDDPPQGQNPSNEVVLSQNLTNLPVQNAPIGVSDDLVNTPTNGGLLAQLDSQDPINQPNFQPVQTRSLQTPVVPHPDQTIAQPVRSFVPSIQDFWNLFLVLINLCLGPVEEHVEQRAQQPVNPHRGSTIPILDEDGTTEEFVEPRNRPTVERPLLSSPPVATSDLHDQAFYDDNQAGTVPLLDFQHWIFDATQQALVYDPNVNIWEADEELLRLIYNLPEDYNGTFPF